MRLAARSKYHAKATVIDNVRFASKAEAARYGELKLLEKAGEISDLKLQPSFLLLAVPIGAERTGQRVVCGKYLADFSYYDKAGVQIIEDVKAPITKTAAYRLKRKIVEATYGIKITEVMSGRRR